MTGQPIPPYTETDERAAREALAVAWHDDHPQLVREVAGAIATARAEGYDEGLAEGACPGCGHRWGDHDERDGCGACALAMTGPCKRWHS